MSIDLDALPEHRRAVVLECYNRELAAERIRDVYPGKIARWRTDEAYRRTAETVIAEGFAFVTTRFVRSVIREGR